MTKHIYKYFSPSLANIALSENGATLKCSLPKDFNDPYELFLTVDFNSDPGALACYQEAIGSIPQLPTTCFSNSPAVSPMWAHYGSNVTGFAVEFDEDLLKEHFPGSQFGDVAYRDEADEGLTEMLYRVHVIKKPRYTYFLQGGVFHAAYFTKTGAWSYESERRMVADETEVRASSELLLLDVPEDCITAIIAGARTNPELVTELQQRATSYSCNFFQMRIGRTQTAPYFLDASGTPYVFNGETIVPAANTCESCKEPLDAGRSKCSWCQISDEHRLEAAMGNPYILLDRVGQLDSYIQSMNDITEKFAK
ncbi:hypothetical protein GCM10008098_19080 [Rhodanobacter panaciterrae]|uniref:DUF2971 domain-containing protein n=1 Tax=Rhodanobacter panaciterrae TaxID=490572 RepID=A0ABQ2ZYA4_9GAMM|nr:DUF2971 domain-containing protein [Rhodanobacter panaciterrae]GGY26290.1 hypothetical protein GCM10008098_19080 [Rhodanobacter panaciterrae]